MNLWLAMEKFKTFNPDDLSIGSLFSSCHSFLNEIFMFKEYFNNWDSDNNFIGSWHKSMGIKVHR
jgi:hypothetical protein